MENKGYSYEELTTPPILKFRKRMQRQLGRVAKVIENALKDKDKNIQLRASDRAVNWAGADPPRKVESKYEVEGTIFHDLTERLEKAIETKKNAIRKATGKSRSTPSDKTDD